MNRFVDLAADGPDRSEPLVLAVGDVVRLSASGARITTGDVVEVLAILTSAVVTTDGRILAPEGPPNVVLLRARDRGDAIVELVMGDVWHARATRTLPIRVA